MYLRWGVQYIPELPYPPQAMLCASDTHHGCNGRGRQGFRSLWYLLPVRRQKDGHRFVKSLRWQDGMQTNNVARPSSVVHKLAPTNLRCFGDGPVSWCLFTDGRRLSSKIPPRRASGGAYRTIGKACERCGGQIVHEKFSARRAIASCSNPDLRPRCC